VAVFQVIDHLANLFFNTFKRCGTRCGKQQATRVEFEAQKKPGTKARWG